MSLLDKQRRHWMTLEQLDALHRRVQDRATAMSYPEWDTVIEMAKAALSSCAATVPEGCTPTDAKVLREGNFQLATENQRLREALRFYANRQHWTCEGAARLEWDTVSGEPQNWRWRENETDDAEGIEDGEIARSALRGENVDWDGDSPPVIEGEPEWHIEQAAKASAVPESAPTRDYCESCGYTDSHDPNCPRPKDDAPASASAASKGWPSLETKSPKGRWPIAVYWCDYWWVKKSHAERNAAPQGAVPTPAEASQAFSRADQGGTGAPSAQPGAGLASIPAVAAPALKCPDNPATCQRPTCDECTLSSSTAPDPGTLKIMTALVERAYGIFTASGVLRAAEQDPNSNDPIVAWASDVRSILYRNKPAPVDQALRVIQTQERNRE